MERKVKIAYYIIFLFFMLFMVLDHKLKGYEKNYGYDVFLQISFYLLVIIAINIGIHHIKKIKNKELRQGALNTSKNLERMYEGSLFHIISFVISLALSFLVFSFIFMLFLFNDYFFILPLGAALIAFPIFYRIFYNHIVFRKIYIKNKKSKPVLTPIISSLFAFFGFGIILFDIIKMLVPFNMLVLIEYAVFFFIISLLIVPVYKYFVLMQKLEIKREDVNNNCSRPNKK